MIKDNRELELSREALLNLEKALLALKEKIEPVNKELFIAMSQDYYNDISRIRSDIEEYLGFTEVERFSVPLWMTIQGMDLSLTNFSLSMLSNWTGKLRKAVQNIITHKESITNLSPTMISKITDFKCVKLLPGSIKIGLKTPNTLKDDLFLGKWLEENRPVEKSVENLLEYIMYLCNSENKESLMQKIESKPDAEFYLMQVLSLSPSTKSEITSVKFEGALSPIKQPLYLNKYSRELIKDVFKESVKEEILEFEGYLREIDLDKNSLTLRDVEGLVGDLSCLFPEKYFEITKKSLAAKIRITGHRKNKTSKIIKIITIESIEDGD